MHVVHLCRRLEGSEWTGPCQAIVETCRRLRSRGNRVRVFCPEVGAEGGEHRVRGVRVHRFPYFYPYIGLTDDDARRLDEEGGEVFSFELLKALQHEEGLELIHSHTCLPVGAIGRHVARQRGIPYVVTLHGPPPSDESELPSPTAGVSWRGVLHWWVGVQRVLEDADALFCKGWRLAESVQEQYPNKRVVYVPPGVDLDRFGQGDGARFRYEHGIRPKARVLLVAGPVSPERNQLLAIRVAERLRAKRHPVHLLLVGPVRNDAYCRQVAREAADRGMAIRMTMIHGLDLTGQEFVDAFHAADVVLAPSSVEGCSSVAEAWAASRPVIAGCSTDALTPHARHCGAVVADPNDEAAWADCASHLLENPEYARCLGEAGRALAKERHSWESVAASVEEVYREVCSEHAVV